MDAPVGPSKPVEHHKSDNESLRSEADGKEGNDGGFITLLVIIQNLYTLGISSVHSWHHCIDELKKDGEVRKDLFSMNIVFNLTAIAQTLEQYVYSAIGGDISQKNLVDREHKTKSFDEIKKKIKTSSK